MPDNIRDLISETKSKADLKAFAPKSNLMMLNGTPLPKMSPTKFGKRVTVVKQTYEELLALKHPPNLHESQSQSNLYRSFAKFQVSQNAKNMEPFSQLKARKELAKS